MSLTEQQGADRVIGMCLDVTPGETVAVLYDADGDRAAAAAVAEAATRAGAEVLRLEVAAAVLGAEVPVEDVPADALGADVLVGVTSVSLYHSTLGRAAADRGARVLAMTGCTHEMLTVGAIEADFVEVEPRVTALAAALADASRLTVTTRAGTELSADLRGRNGEACTGRAASKGDRSGFPDIEAFIAPIEAATQGRLVVDASSTTHGIVDGPITVEVVDGRARGFSGGEHAVQIQRLLQDLGPSAMTLAEFGFGLNPCARVIGKIIEDEATLGTGHVAFGSNVGFGGANSAPIHLDLVYWRPTLLLDDQVVIEDGVHRLG